MNKVQKAFSWHLPADLTAFLHAILRPVRLLDERERKYKAENKRCLDCNSLLPAALTLSVHMRASEFKSRQLYYWLCPF